MECAGLPDSGYLPFRDRLYRKAIRSRVPLAGSIETTACCNLRCRHCYVAGEAGRCDEMSTEEQLDLIDQLADAGCLWLLVTGGEPLMRSDFEAFYTHVKRRGILPMVFTNGTLVTNEIADMLAEMPPYLVEVSVYGASRETYETVTGVAGSYERCMAGIGRLVDRGIRLELKTMAMTLNMHELAEMKSMAKFYGIPFRYDTLLNRTLGGGDAPLRYRLSPRQTVELDESDPERRSECRRLVEDFRGGSSEGDRIYQCGAGSSTFHIDPAGRLSVCMMSRQESYDLRLGTFREGWERFIPEVLSMEWSRDVPCRSCPLRSMCGQCAGWGWLDHGDPEARVDYLCEVACRRADMLGVRCPRPYDTGGTSATGEGR